jgi:anti-sigma factor RsiW
MNQCQEIRSRIPFYLDDELHDREFAELESHLEGCPACHEFCEEERSLRETIRSARPLYEPSADLRTRIEGLLEGGSVPLAAPQWLRQRIEETLVHTDRFWMRLGAVAAVTILIAGALLLVGKQKHRFEQPSDFAVMAVDSHLRRVRGQLPLEITSDSADQISDWFVGKVPFEVKLPNYQESSGQERLYRIEGARLVGFNHDYAAQVAYQMKQRPITLVITSNAVAMPAAGERIVSRGLTFHYDSINGLKVITWADRGLTYALVSDLEERGQQSCLVCHAGTKDRDFIEGLRPQL